MAFLPLGLISLLQGGTNTSNSEHCSDIRIATWRLSTIFMTGICLFVATILGQLFIRYRRQRQIRARQRLTRRPDGRALPVSISVKKARPMVPLLPPQHEADDWDVPPRGNPWADEFQDQNMDSSAGQPPDLQQSSPPSSPESLHFLNLMSHLPAPSNFPVPSESSDNIIRHQRKVYRHGAHVKSILEEQALHGRWRRRMVVYANGSEGGEPELRGWGGQRRPRPHESDAIELNGSDH